ncbi:MAG: nucleotide pyrophosphohydrolase [Solirubrobacterales bacterium]
MTENTKESRKVSPVDRGGEGGDAPSIAELTRRLVAFRDARDWGQFHTVKNLMLSLALEAAEVLEIAQWKTDEQVEAAMADEGVRSRLSEECADVFLYLLLLCERTGIDLAAAAAAKIEVNGTRYPVAKAKGNALKYNEFA